MTKAVWGSSYSAGPERGRSTPLRGTFTRLRLRSNSGTPVPAEPGPHSCWLGYVTSAGCQRLWSARVS